MVITEYINWTLHKVYSGDGKLVDNVRVFTDDTQNLLKIEYATNLGRIVITNVDNYYFRIDYPKNIFSVSSIGFVHSLNCHKILKSWNSLDIVTESEKGNLIERVYRYQENLTKP